jgi:hypothetical protein
MTNCSLFFRKSYDNVQLILTVRWSGRVNGSDGPFPRWYSTVCSVKAQVKYGVRSLKFIWAPVYSCFHWLRPCNSRPHPAFGLIYQGQDRRHLFVTPGVKVIRQRVYTVCIVYLPSTIARVRTLCE